MSIVFILFPGGIGLPLPMPSNCEAFKLIRPVPLAPARTPAWTVPVKLAAGTEVSEAGGTEPVKSAVRLVNPERFWKEFRSSSTPHLGAHQPTGFSEGAEPRTRGARALP